MFHNSDKAGHHGERGCDLKLAIAGLKPTRDWCMCICFRSTGFISKNVQSFSLHHQWHDNYFSGWELLDTTKRQNKSYLHRAYKGITCQPSRQEGKLSPCDDDVPRACRRREAENFFTLLEDSLRKNLFSKRQGK